MTATDSLTGLTVTLTGDDIPDSGAGRLTVDSTGCGALSGSWEIPFTGTVLEGDFVANRAIDGDFGTAWQRLQQTGLDLLTSIDEGGPVPVDAIRLYLADAEAVMGDTTRRDSTCDEGTFQRFNTAALSLGDAMISVLIARIPELSDDELLEVTRMDTDRRVRGGRPGVPVPGRIGHAHDRTTSTDGDVPAMEYWLPVALEFGSFDPRPQPGGRDRGCPITRPQPACETSGGGRCGGTGARGLRVGWRRRRWRVVASRLGRIGTRCDGRRRVHQQPEPVPDTEPRVTEPEAPA